MSELLRAYAPEECGNDGYPYAWHRTIKRLVRERAGNRCLRCGHPYAEGDGEWSPCDEHCTHQDNGPIRVIAVRGASAIGLDVPEINPGDLLGVYQAYNGGLETARAGWDYQLGKGLVRLEAQWRVLTTHHLNGVKADCRWHNLVPLCQRCHLHIQAKVEMDRPWPWQHTAWFQIYAAAFYAVKYLETELSRPEVEARLEPLLALGLERESEERLPV